MVVVQRSEENVANGRGEEASFQRVLHLQVLGPVKEEENDGQCYDCHQKHHEEEKEIEIGREWFARAIVFHHFPLIPIEGENVVHGLVA